MSDAQPLTVPPAGWYPDRNEANLVRWWDGQEWTDQTRSTAPAAAAFEQPVSAAAFGLASVAPAASPYVAADPVPQATPAAQQFPTAQQFPAQQLPAQQLPTAQQLPATASPQIVPGWYPDNRDPSLLRWWDGTQWTAQTTPMAPVHLTMPVGGFSGAIEPVSSRSNSMATLSLVLSIISFAGLIVGWFLSLALAGVIVGIVALVRAPRFAPSGRRRGQAIAGIVLGAVSLVVTVLLTIAAVLAYVQTHGTTPSQSGDPANAQTAQGIALSGG